MGELTTDLCQRLQIEHPIAQAPIGSASTPELVAAVADAGGLGMLSLTWTPSDQIRDRLRDVRGKTTRPFGANLVLDFPIRDKLEVCLAEGVPIISTFWGNPRTVHDEIHRAGSLHFHSVGSADEAKRAADAGVDVIVAQGWEAGGHVRGTVATLPLVPAVIDAVDPIPVIAAGGIADGRGLAAVLALGAQAGWLGTRFLTATEANTHEVYRQRVIAANAEDATYTLCFADGWPDAPHRAIRNTTLTTWVAAGHPGSPDRPGEGEIVATDATGSEHRRYSDIMPLRGMTGDLQELALYAGQSAGLVHHVMPAREIVTQIMTEATNALRKQSDNKSGI